MMKKTALVVAVLLLAGAVTAQDMIGPLPAFGRTYTGSTRGFFCQAPVDFFVHGLRVPDESAKGFQYVALMRSATSLLAYPTTVNITPDFLETTGTAPSANILPCKVLYTKGEFLMVIGGCAAGAGSVSNSYASATGGQPATILGNATTLSRCGVQASIATATVGPYAMWAEVGGSISRVEVYVSDAYLTGDKPAPKPGETVTFALEGLAADAGNSYYMASSLGMGPTSVAGRNVWLSTDLLFQVSLSGVLPGIFANYAGMLDKSSKASAKLNLPKIAALVGIDVYTAYVVFNGSAFSAFSNPFMIDIS
jgi:hypothetical protein